MRVLFVGNSYTLYGDVPGQVAALAAADEGGPALEAERVAEGGATWVRHWQDTGARARIDEGGFSHVVLQDKSTQSLHDQEDFRRYGVLLAERARERGAKVLLYATWARREGHEIYRWAWSGRGPAEMTRRVRAAYDALAAEVGADVAPVGDAWERARREAPELVLHDDDLHHASALGSHLVALVLYRALTGRDPAAVPYRPADVSAEAAAALRAFA